MMLDIDLITQKGHTKALAGHKNKESTKAKANTGITKTKANT